MVAPANSSTGTQGLPPRDDRNGRLTLDGYDIRRELGHGSQAIVYQAIQQVTNRKVAIKVLRNVPEFRAEALARFRREIKFLAELSHPNIVSIYHSGDTPDGRPFFVMEYVRGLPARRYVVENHLSVIQILELFVTICRAVDCLHARGFIHRDLKPSNILVTAEGQAKVLDLGIAKSLRGPAESQFTCTGVVLGSFLYMSPEQTRAHPDQIDARSDVYSLGVLLFELLTGQFPYAISGSPADVMKRITDATPIRPSRAARSAERSQGLIGGGAAPASPGLIDEILDAIVCKALEKECDHRYANAGAFADDVNRYLRGEPTVARPDRWDQSVRRRVRRLARGHVAAACVAAILFSAALANYPGVPLIFLWTGANSLFERTVTGLGATVPSSVWFQQLRMITLSPQTDVAGLATRAGLKDVSREQWRSVRRLHGWLMKEKLAKSECRAVVWDITFVAPSDFDEDFALGAQALKAKNIDVVVAVPKWRLGTDGTPEVSSKIARYVQTGSAGACAFEAGHPWSVTLVARRGLRDAQPSLALAAYAAFRRPGVEYHVDLERSALSTGLVHLGFHDGDRARTMEDPEPIRLTSVLPFEELVGQDVGTHGLAAGDLVGQLVFDVPATPVCEAAETEYAELFSASETQLRDQFAGKIILIGDRDPDPQHEEWSRHPDGRELPRVYGQAAAIDTLLRSAAADPNPSRDDADSAAAAFNAPRHDKPVTMPLWWHQNGMPLAGAVLGALAGMFTARTTRRRILLGLALTVAIAAVSAFGYRMFRVLVNPGVFLLAMWIAIESVAAIQRTKPTHVPKPFSE